MEPERLGTLREAAMRALVDFNTLGPEAMPSRCRPDAGTERSGVPGCEPVQRAVSHWK